MSAKVEIDKNILIKLLDEKLTYQEIADRLGVSKKAVGKRIVEYGLLCSRKILPTKEEIQNMESKGVPAYKAAEILKVAHKTYTQLATEYNIVIKNKQIVEKPKCQNPNCNNLCRSTRNKYCCLECSNAESSKIAYPCDNCGKINLYSPSTTSPNINHFCPIPKDENGKIIKDSSGKIPQRCESEWRAKNIVGENNPLFKGYPRDYGFAWRKVRKFVRERDRETCLGCRQIPVGGVCEANHGIPARLFKDNGRKSNHPSNVYLLWALCHDAVEKINRLFWTQEFFDSTNIKQSFPMVGEEAFVPYSICFNPLQRNINFKDHYIVKNDRLITQ